MKILPASIEKFILDPGNIKAILIYGPNAGLISIYVDKLIKNLIADSEKFFSLTSIDYDKIKSDPTELRMLTASMNLLGSKKIIKITNVSNNFNAEIKNIFSNINNSNFIILVGEELPSNSALRKFFETDPSSAVIACYAEDEANLKKFIINYLKTRSYDLSNDAYNMIDEFIIGDRLYIENELEKLILYVGEKRIIDSDDIRSSMSVSTNSSMEEFCLKIICKEINSLNMLDNLIKENISIVSIIRNLSRYFNKLYHIRTEIENGSSSGNAIGSLTPPLFFKQVPIFTKSIKLWKLQDLNKVIANLLELEINSKKTGNLTKLMLTDFLMKIITNN